MTSVAEKIRAGRHGIADRWHNAPRWVRWVGIIALIAFFYALPNKEFYQWLGPIPTTGSNFGHVLFTVSIYALLAVGLNIVVGFAGLLDLGYIAFYAVGAYVYALLASPPVRRVLEPFTNPLGWLEHRRELDQTFSPVVPPIDRIMNCFRNFRSEQEELLKKHGRVLGCPIHTLGAEISTVEDRLRNKLQCILSQFILYYECAVRDADAQGIINAEDPNALARIIFAYSEGLLLHARMWNDLSYLDEFEKGAMIILGVNKIPAKKTVKKAAKIPKKALSALSN